MNPKVIILSGGPNSVHVEGSPRVPEEFFEYCRTENIPVLGICYGMQLIVQVSRQPGQGHVSACSRSAQYCKCVLCSLLACRQTLHFEASCIRSSNNSWVAYLPFSTARVCSHVTLLTHLPVLTASCCRPTFTPPVQMLGGTVTSGVVGGEYGRMPIDIQPGSRLYSYQDNQKPNVWMSHGDEATKLPDGFRVVAKSEQVGAVISGPDFYRLLPAALQVVLWAVKLPAWGDLGRRRPRNNSRIDMRRQLQQLLPQQLTTARCVKCSPSCLVPWYIIMRRVLLLRLRTPSGASLASSTTPR